MERKSRAGAGAVRSSERLARARWGRLNQQKWKKKRSDQLQKKQSEGGGS